MTHDAVAASQPGVALAACSCGWRERIEHGTRAMARTLADEHLRHVRVLGEALPAGAVA